MWSLTPTSVLPNVPLRDLLPADGSAVCASLRSSGGFFCLLSSEIMIRKLALHVIDPNSNVFV